MVLCSRKFLLFQHRHIRPKRKFALTSCSNIFRIYPPNYICLVGYVCIISYFSYNVNRILKIFQKNLYFSSNSFTAGLSYINFWLNAPRNMTLLCHRKQLLSFFLLYVIFLERSFRERRSVHPPCSCRFKRAYSLGERTSRSAYIIYDKKRLSCDIRSFLP